MDNIKLKKLVIVLTIITIVLTRYIIYDKITEKSLSSTNNNNEEITDNQLNNENENNKLTNNYNIENIYGIYGSENGINETDLLLWDDKTYKYTYNLGEQNKAGYLGTYEIENNYLILNNMFEIENDVAKVITEKNIIKLKINSEVELYDENNKITLNKFNQPFGPNNDFYSNLKYLIK